MTPWFVLTHKILPLIFLPLGVTLMLLAWGIWTRRRLPLLGAAGVLWITGAPITSDLLLQFFENQYPELTVEAAPAADAIMVLGGMYSRPEGATRGNWGQAVDRFELGIALYRAEKAPVLLLSAAAKPTDGGPSEGEMLRDFAIERGLPADCVVVTPHAPNTDAEARVVRDLLDRYGWERVLLVTSAFHMPRAMMLFQSHGVDVVAMPTDFMSGGCTMARPSSMAQCLVPDARGILGVQIAMRESMGYIFYWLRLQA